LNCGVASAQSSVVRADSTGTPPKQQPLPPTSPAGRGINDNDVFSAQVRLYDFTLKALGILVGLLTLVTGVGGYLLYRDRKAMRDEIMADAAKAVQDARSTLEAMTREIETKWQEISADMNAKRSELEQKAAAIKAEANDSFLALRGQLENEVTGIAAEERRRLQERISYYRQQLANQDQGAEPPTSQTSLGTQPSGCQPQAQDRGDSGAQQVTPGT
jgi:hypothetical protein